MPALVNPILSPAHASLIQGAVSINVASRDNTRQPSVTRCYGCRLIENSNTVCVYVLADHATLLLRDVADNGILAAVFSRPSTHETIQLKTCNASVHELSADDRITIERYRKLILEELQGIGFPRSFAGALVAEVSAPAIAIHFTPQEVFVQTPGPRAGEKITP